MAIVVQFVREYAIWVYGACALVALICLRGAFLARRERRWSMFGLEREQALNKTYRIWSWAFMLLIMMGAVYLISTVVSDAVEPLVERQATPQPTSARAAAGSATPTLPVLEPTQAPARPTAAATAKSKPSPTPEPTRAAPTPAPAVQSPGCPDPRAVINAPGNNARVSGRVPIIGTATHDKFQYYKLEYGVGTNPGVWSYFAGGERPVAGGQLGVLNADALAPGAYSIRIVVVDLSGNFPAPCITVVVIG